MSLTRRQKTLIKYMQKYDFKVEGIYEKIEDNTIIKFICICGNNGEKKYCNISKGGALCKSCISKKKFNSLKEAINKKYGVDNISQLK